ncbi:MAG: hypothetical protein FJZ57_02840 [Chlamydiae bacterium]|nr:hypothetical protein [Chlamydiota bacterium]
MPKKKSKRYPLTEEEKINNQELSKDRIFPAKTSDKAFFQYNLEMEKFLLSDNKEINAKDRGKAVEEAAKHDNLEMVNFLLGG